MRADLRWLAWGLALALAGCATEKPVASAPKVVEYPIGPAYAATEVNATIFRLQALASDAKYQYATYYDAAGKIVVARRLLSGQDWEVRTLDTTGKVSDAHNDVVLGLGPDGTLHLSYDHHNEPLHYRRTSGTGDWAAFGAPEGMTGKLETRVTYPTFVSAPSGDLWFFYRDGQSGNGRLCIDRYDANTRTWQAVQSPLIEGAGKCSPYWWRPEIGVDGVINVAWCWRDTPDAATNHDICYVRSRDGGKTWENSAGKVLPTPILPGADVVVEKIPPGQNLINTCALATDAQGRPHISYYRNDSQGVPQYFHLWFDGQKWSAAQVSQRTEAFSLGGQGTLEIPMSRPEIAVSQSGTAYLITRDNAAGGGLRLYAAKPPYTDWKPTDVVAGPLGDWEPEYDLQRWRRDGVLSLFVLPVSQGNHEQTTGRAPETARVVEVSGLE
jgi:hypothetical protein